jgi:spore maturation protein CgeB
MRCERQQQWEKALYNYQKVLEIEPDSVDAMLGSGLCLFNQRNYKPALLMFVRYHQHSKTIPEMKEKLLQDILQSYYLPNETSLQQTYEGNTGLLKNYPLNFIKDFLPFESLPYQCIPASPDHYFILDKGSRQFIMEISLRETNHEYSSFTPNMVILSYNVFHQSTIMKILNQTKDDSLVNHMKCPLYLIWAEPLRSIFVQVNSYEPVISGGRTVFFDNDGSYKEYFRNNYRAILPQIILGSKENTELINREMEVIIQESEVNFSERFNEMNHYCQSFSKQYHQRLLSGKPERTRILFVTTRFSQVIQYTTRDYMNACCNLGYTCDLLIEGSDIERVFQNTIIVKIAEWKPDIIFIINYFRLHYESIPENIIVITWINDVMDILKSPEAAQKIKENDYIFCYSNKIKQEMEQAGFPASKMTVHPIPIDDTVYYPREIPAGERVFYSADVAVCVNNNSDPELLLKDLIIATPVADLDDSGKIRIIRLYTNVYDYIQQIIQKGELIVSRQQCRAIILEFCRKMDVQIADSFLQFLVERYYLYVSYGLHRRQTLRALIDAAISVKIWGKNWDSSEEFAAYSMGWVKPGDELAKVYSGAKIVIGAFSHGTAHYRVWEATSCGALCMVRNVPPEYDHADIRDYLTPGEHFIFFDNETDLINKTRYYLEHEPERMKIAANGGKRIREILTYRVAVQKTFSFLRDSYSS